MAKKNLEHFFEVQGNNGANYIQIGKFSDGDNRIFLEVGDCCCVMFRGVITSEMLSSALTNLILKGDDGLINALKREMRWDAETNEKLSQGAKELKWHEKPV